MRILQITGPHQVEWLEVDMPRPGPGEVLVKVTQVNTCPHWDMHILDGRPMFSGGTLNYPYTPGQPGHEAVGTIAAVGDGVEDMSEGKRVACWRDAGHHRQGCYAQYVVMNADHVLPVPDSVSADAVTSLELAMCVQISFDQLARIDGVRGRRFAVSGLGPAGLVAVQMARAYGAKTVIGVEPVKSRRKLALSLGADEVVDPGSAEWEAGRTGTHAVYSALDCTGLKPSIEFLMDRTQRAVAIFGVLRETLAYTPAHFGGLWLIGYEGHNKEAARRALALITRGELDLACLISDTLPFTRYEEGIERLRRQDALKICYQPWEA